MLDQTKDINVREKIILKVINGEITNKEAAFELELSDRQFIRIKKNYMNGGIDKLINKNKGKHSPKKFSQKIEEKIVDDYIQNYPDYNFTHYYEEHGYTHGISYSKMVEIFKRYDIVSPLAQRNTVKLYNEAMKKAMRENKLTDEQTELYKKRREAEKYRHIRRSNIQYSFGEQIQMDAAVWNWFGDIDSNLHLAVDKATKKVLGGWFDYEETTEAYFFLLFQIIKNYGIPKYIRTDKRGTFSINNAKTVKSKLNISQFKRACIDLEISLSSKSYPTFKPNVERENKTFKGRLKAELKHENIANMEDANKYLLDVFIPKMNKKFSYDIDENKNQMRKNTYTDEELKIIISYRKERTVDNASSIKYDNNYYLLVDKDSGEIIMFTSGTKCCVIITLDNELFAMINNKIYDLKLVELNDSDKKQNASKNGYKPKENNPFRKWHL